jgi:hypothetical protein
MSGPVTALLMRCQRTGLLLTVDGDKLDVDYEREPPRELIEELRRHKAEIMAALARAESVAAPSHPPPIRPQTARLGIACCECGRPFTGRVNTWWGGLPCHRACGEAAFLSNWPDIVVVPEMTEQ